jgi:hypothetical protein
MIQRLATILLLIAAADVAVAAQCVNKFVARRDGKFQSVTLLTGALTFDEAKKLAAGIQNGKNPPIEWLDEKGKAIARQFGELKVVRPMPVGCDGRTSGVVVTANFLSVNPPVKLMSVKLTPSATVVFTEQ